MQWDLAMIEPGLHLRVGPTLQADSILEFTMDPVQDRDRYLMEEPSTGTFKLTERASSILSRSIHISDITDSPIEQPLDKIFSCFYYFLHVFHVFSNNGSASTNETIHYSISTWSQI